MSARVIDLAQERARRLGPADETIVLTQTIPETVTEQAERFQFWTGASGKRYVHTVYNLLDCPALPAGNYILVKKSPSGQRSVLSIGRVTHQAPSLNLADIRRRGAEFGANEVHVHLLAGNAKQSKLIEFDLKTAQAVEGAHVRTKALH
jgi:hypothetical protein